MKIHCIQTGSSGNCYLVEYTKNKYFMLDCGVPESMIFAYLQQHKISPSHIKFCLISHLHIDHLHDSKFINMFSIPTYFPKLNKKNVPQNEIHKNLVNYIGLYVDKTFSPFEENNIKIEPFVVPHDDYNFAYKITLPDGKKLIYLTDFGNTRTLPVFMEKIDFWLIECNYGIETIEKLDGIVQRRSKSDTGHCSNQDCFDYLSLQPRIIESKILLLHRSHDNLNPKTDYKIFDDLNCQLVQPIQNWSYEDL